MSCRSSAGERGQATPLWAIVLVLAGLLLIPTGLLIRATLERAQARTAADAAALAGALATDGAGRQDAESIAADNGAVLVSYTETVAQSLGGAVVEVTVRVGSHRATARAERQVTRTPASVPDG